MFRDPNYSNLLFFRILADEQRVLHFSTTRTGGVSRGNFRSLNLGNYSDDDPLNIFENRSIVARKFYKEANDLITPHQTHGNRVLLIDAAFLDLPNAEKLERLYGYDASITREKGFFSVSPRPTAYRCCCSTGRTRPSPPFMRDGEVQREELLNAR